MAESLAAVLLPLLGVVDRTFGIVDLAQLHVRLLEVVPTGSFLVGQEREWFKVGDAVGNRS